MSKVIFLKDSTQELTSDQSANNVYLLISKELSNHEIVEINFEGILGITTYCAKNIFGRLYVELNANNFPRRIVFSNLSKDYKLIIQQGILDYIRASA